MKTIAQIIVIILIFSSCSLLASCGQDGPLYLPQKNSAKHSQET